MEVDLPEFGVTAREVVERLWNDVATEQAGRSEPSLERLPDVPVLADDQERWYLNHHWAVARVPSRFETSGAPRGIKRRVKARAAQFVMRVLEAHFEEEQEFRVHLVRLQNTLTVELDRLSSEVREVHEALSRELERLRQAQAAMHASLEDRVAALERSTSVASIPGAQD